MDRRYFLISILLALGLLLVLEGLVRISGFVDIRRTRGWGHSFDCCGDLRPNQKILSLIAKDHPYVIQTNNLGLRNTEKTTIPKEDIFRILAMGDSFTFGPYVSNEETWPARLEQFLRATSVDKKIEVLNAGIASYTITDELAYLKEKGLSLESNLVVLNVTYNDIADLRKLQRGYFARPLSHEKSDIFRQQFKNLFYDHSYFVSMLVELKHSRIIQDVLSEQSKTDDGQLFTEIISGKNTQYHSSYEKYLNEFAEILADQNIPFVVLFYPDAEMISKGTISFLKTIADNNSFWLVDAGDAVSTNKKELVYLLPWNGHPSTTGYYLTAKYLHDFLIEKNLIQ